MKTLSFYTEHIKSQCHMRTSFTSFTHISCVWKLLLFTHYWNKTKVKYTHCEILLTSNILQLCRYCSTQQHFSPLSSELGLDSFFQPNCALDYCPAARPSFGGFRCQTNFGIQKSSWSIQWLQEWLCRMLWMQNKHKTTPKQIC